MDTIRDILKQWPDELKQELLALDIPSELATIDGMNVLNPEQTQEVENILVLIFIGLGDPSLLATNISHNAQISRDRAEMLANHIGEHILAPHESFLTKMYTFMDTHVFAQNKTSELQPTNNSVPTASTKRNETKRIKPVPNNAPTTQVPKKAPVPTKAIAWTESGGDFKVASKAANAAPETATTEDSGPAKLTKREGELLDMFAQKMKTPAETPQSMGVLKSVGDETRARQEKANADPYKESID